MTITKIESMAHQNQYKKDHVGSWFIGALSAWRIGPAGKFSQNPSTGTRVYAVPSRDELGELVAFGLDPATLMIRTSTGTYRRWGYTTVFSEVAEELAKFGLAIDPTGTLQPVDAVEPVARIDVRTPRGMRGSAAPVPIPVPQTAAEQRGALQAEKDAAIARQAELDTKLADLSAKELAEIDAEDAALRAKLAEITARKANLSPAVERVQAREIAAQNGKIPASERAGGSNERKAG